MAAGLPLTPPAAGQDDFGRFFIIL